MPNKPPMRPTVIAPREAGGPDEAARAEGENPPRGFKPTALPGSAPPRPSTAPPVRPTALPAGVPARPAAQAVAARIAESIQASALPGVRRAPIDVSISELVRRFPHAATPTVQRAQALLAGIHPDHMHAPAWLGFGTEVQEELASLVKQRLALAQDPGVRAVPRHLGQLNLLLSEVLEALEGGFLRKPAAKVWADVRPEVVQLEQLLQAGTTLLIGHLHALDAQKRPAQDCGDSLEAYVLAAEYLIDRIPADTGSLLLARNTSLVGSQAMLKEHLLYLEHDLRATQELTALVQDGVLLKLPAVYAQLASLSGRPSATQRFLAVEKLTDVLQLVKKLEYS